MFAALKRLSAKVEEVEVEVVSRERSADGEHYTVLFKETGGERTFTKTFEWYGPGGMPAPRPMLEEKATLHVNRHGEIVYAGSA